MRSYELVKERKLTELKEYVADHFIDEWLPGEYYYSATSKFAEEGDFNSMEIMLYHGASVNYAAMGAAMGGHEDYADQLIERGAAITYVICGAARGGHDTYIDKLKARANLDYSNFIDPIQMGAGLGGNIAFALMMREKHNMTYGIPFKWGVAYAKNEDMLNYIEVGYEEKIVRLGFFADESIFDATQVTFHLDYAAYNAGLGGQLEIIKKLLASCIYSQKRTLNTAAEGAAQAGHQDILQVLIEWGAEISQLVEGACRGDHLMFLSRILCNFANQGLERPSNLAYHDHHFSRGGKLIHPRSQLVYLSVFPQKTIRTFVKMHANKSTRVFTDKTVVEHACAISNARQIGISFDLARLATERDLRGRLMHDAAVMMAISSFVTVRDNAPYLGLHQDIWVKILNQVFDEHLCKAQWQVMMLALAKARMTTALVNYTQFYRLGAHKQRALSFIEAVQETKSAADLKALIMEQKKLVLDREKKAYGQAKHQQPLQNKRVDGYHHFISMWSKRFNLSQVEMINNASDDEVVTLSENSNGIELMPMQRRSANPLHVNIRQRGN